MITCPAGHDSESEDYCDTCGMPIEQDAPRSPSPSGTQTATGATAPPAAAVVVSCPNCDTENVADALFCEACGYDFTTGTMPRPMVNPFATLPGDADDRPTPAPEAQPTPTPPDATVQPDARTDAGPDPDDDAVGLPKAPGSPGDAPAAASADPRPTMIAEPPAGPADEPDADQPPSAMEHTPPPQPLRETPDPPAPAPAGQTTTVAGQPTEPFVPGGFDTQTFESRTGDTGDDAPTVPFEWVAEVWVDPDWYRQQEPPDPMPSPGLPEVIPLRRRSVLIGRPSRSRNITPDIDCESDPGASRRQAQLTTDGRRWFVEDLDSSNGTYVAGAAEPLPTQPLRASSRHELDPDDRIYLGAWTRLVIRRATPEEHEAYG